MGRAWRKLPKLAFRIVAVPELGGEDLRGLAGHLWQRHKVLTRCVAIIALRVKHKCSTVSGTECFDAPGDRHISGP
jgi:hypothetical protein